MAPAGYVFARRSPPTKAAGLPHSEIPGSKPVDGSPRLVAVFHVLLRLLMPRHPSCARIRLAEFVFMNPCLEKTFLDLVYELQFSLVSSSRFSKIKKCLRLLVEVVGFEPATFCLQSRHSTN